MAGVVIVAAAVGGTIVALAVSGGSRSGDVASRGTATVPPGWSVHRDEASGFAIAYPSSWVDVTDAARRRFPEYKKYLKFAVGEQGSGDNVNVIEEPIPAGFDVDTYASVNERQLVSAGGNNMQRTKDSVPAGPAVVLSYTGGESIAAGHFVQYFLVHRSHGYVITLTTVSGRTFDPALIRQFMNSFEFLD